jgi:hypothetical protein
MRVNINKDRVQQRVGAAKAKSAARGGSNANWWKPSPGNNVVRLFAFNHDGEGEFFRELRMHQPPKGKPQPCGKNTASNGETRSECSLCDEARRIEQERGRDAASRFRARTRYAFIVVPIRDGGNLVPAEDRKPKVWQASKTVGEKILDCVCDDDIVDDPAEFFGCKGLNVKIKYDPDAKGADMYATSVLQAAKAKTLAGTLQDEAQKMDLFADMSLEPEWFVAEGGAATTSSESEPEDDDDDFDDEDEDGDEADESEADEDGDEADESEAEDESEADDEVPEEVLDEVREARAKLEKDGLSDSYECDPAEDEESGEWRPCYFKAGDDDAPGSWEYPKPKRTRKKRTTKKKAPAKKAESDEDREARVEKAAEGMKPRNGAAKKRGAPQDMDEDGDE